MVIFVTQKYPGTDIAWSSEWCTKESEAYFSPSYARDGGNTYIYTILLFASTKNTGKRFVFQTEKQTAFLQVHWFSLYESVKTWLLLEGSGRGGVFNSFSII